jgi:2-polyprenyl-3-methyl-5-hydroxy-6-metoxy-1,4-benzoquinol methylase
MPEQLDREGHLTLKVISGADNFNQWMFDRIRPFIKGRVLEIGSGIGNISNLLLNTQKEVALSDYSTAYLDILRRNFSSHPHLSGLLSIDLVDPRFDEKFSSFFGSFDTVIALNVIEHIQDDDLAIGNCKKLLKKGGHFIILVPAYPLLYNRFDKELGHYRRYTKRTLGLALSRHFTVAQNRYFNLAGIAGWVFSGAILRKKIIPPSQMKVFNTLVPLFRIMDKMVMNRIGLSVWAVSVAS